MAKSELFDMPFVGRMQRAFGSFPVNRGAPDRAALKLSATLLSAGDAVAIYPEGQLSETGELQEIKPGVSLIIRMAAGIPVICCRLRNTQKIIPYGQIIPRPAFRTVTVDWGQPRVFDKSSSTEEILEWIRKELL
jgi:1-acyl-sn-glycerol-3-phosphate acyltransferase